MDLSRTSPEPNPPRIERRRTVGETPESTWSPRPKPVSTACERCRRRKIRCDGETPCATCSRFSLACIRPRKSSETQAALEQRVRQLEAQIADLSTNLSTPRGRASPIPLTLDTQFESSRQPTLKPYFTDVDPPPLDIPRIEVVDCAHLSPTSLPPTPSLPSAASGASSPLSATMDTGLTLPTYGMTLSPPMSSCPSPSYDSLPYLSPTSLPETAASRRSSVSSLGLDMDWGPSSFSISDRADDSMGLNAFGSFSSPEIQIIATAPTRFETETLLEAFFDRASGCGYPIDRDLFRAFLQMIDSPWDHSGGHMPRFYVYIGIAIGLRLKTDNRPSENQLLENCYRLALDQVRSPQFWGQPLAGEAAMLLVLFARASQRFGC